MSQGNFSFHSTDFHPWISATQQHEAPVRWQQQLTGLWWLSMAEPWNEKQLYSNASPPQTVKKNLKMTSYERTAFLVRNPVCEPEIGPVIEASLKSN